MGQLGEAAHAERAQGLVLREHQARAAHLLLAGRENQISHSTAGRSAAAIRSSHHSTACVTWL
ncbi:hypothetical protein [Amycolatopsis rubida]|uniref:hypothetical protein n=1 Tax=Amycolatopsis rubida TaxID=112413 RepID=UPI001FCAD1E0|nr:hypothetical protein [Amycolatopsis rubida]